MACARRKGLKANAYRVRRDTRLSTLATTTKYYCFIVTAATAPTTDENNAAAWTGGKWRPHAPNATPHSRTSSPVLRDHECPHGGKAKRLRITHGLPFLPVPPLFHPRRHPLVELSQRSCRKTFGGRNAGRGVGVEFECHTAMTGFVWEDLWRAGKAMVFMRCLAFYGTQYMAVCFGHPQALFIPTS